MSDRKNYNSIVFLTTLGVYLGLVLAGGTSPSVLAQAALTRDFDIKNEIVVEDDLDKKPDEDLFAKKPDEDLFAESIVNLVEELDNLSKARIFEWNVKDTLRIEDLEFSEKDGLPSLFGSGSINPQVDAALEKTALELARKLYAEKTRLGFWDIYSHSSDYDFVFDGRSLELKIKVGNGHRVAPENDTDVLPFYNELNNYLAEKTSVKNAAKSKIVAENTKVTTENNQVFIVTRLPRASLDDLLADK